MGQKSFLIKPLTRNWPIEIVCLIGKPPPEYNDATGTGPEGVAASLKTVDARIVFYDELLTNAEKAYADYLQEHVKIDRLWEVFEAIDDFSPPPKPKKGREKKDLQEVSDKVSADDGST